MHSYLHQHTVLPSSALSTPLLVPNPMFTIACSQQIPTYFLPSSSASSNIVITTDKLESTSSSDHSFSPISSNEKHKVKRGRPQQNIQDDEDPLSQKRKQRRLYARQYRAHMRSQIDEIKKLHDDTRMLKNKHQKEVNKLNQTIMELLRINQQLFPAAIMNTTTTHIMP